MNEIQKAKRQLSIEKWTKIFQECNESGLTAKDFMKLHGILETQYYYWLRVIRKEILNHQDTNNQLQHQPTVISQDSPDVPEPIKFVQLSSSASAQTATCIIPESQVGQTDYHEKISVSYQGFTVEITESTPKALLLRTLALLKTL